MYIPPPSSPAIIPSAVILATRALVADDSGGGGIHKSTAIGIGVGLALFLLLLLSFYLVSKYRPPPRPITQSDIQNEATLQRWTHNIAGQGKTARLEQHKEQFHEYPPPPPPYKKRASTGLSSIEGSGSSEGAHTHPGHARNDSVLSGATIVESEYHPIQPTLPGAPPQAHPPPRGRSLIR